RGHSRGQYHRFLIARLEGMETVQQHFFLREALPYKGRGVLRHTANRAITVYYHAADPLPGEQRFHHLDTHICREAAYGSTKIDRIADRGTLRHAQAAHLLLERCGKLRDTQTALAEGVSQHHAPRPPQRRDTDGRLPQAWHFHERMGDIQTELEARGLHQTG